MYNNVKLNFSNEHFNLQVNSIQAILENIMVYDELHKRKIFRGRIGSVRYP